MEPHSPLYTPQQLTQIFSTQQSLAAALLLAPLVLFTTVTMLRPAKISFYHGKNSIRIPLKPKSTSTKQSQHVRDNGPADDRASNGTEETTLADLVKSITPPCRLNPFLFNGHLQTMWTVTKSDTVPIHYKRRLFEQEDPVYRGSFAVDFVVTKSEFGQGQGDDKGGVTDYGLPPRTRYYTDTEFAEIASDDNRPMLVLLHGLSGGSYELYLRHVLAPLVGLGDDPGLGWEACVVNSRGCAGSKITTSVLYNARATWDVRQMVKWLRKTFPNRPLFGIGFSLGANIMANYVAEEGRDCVFKAAVAISNPWTLDVSNLFLQRTWLGLNVYSKVMGTNMKKLFVTHKQDIMADSKIDVEEVERVRYLHEFDRAVQCPTWGYPTEAAYYRDAASSDSVLAIRIPFLAINAEDDPISADAALPRQEFLESPYGVLLTTAVGGHLSWYEWGGGRWFSRVTTAFFEKMARDVDFDQYSKAHPLPDSHVVRFSPQDGKPWFNPMRRKMHLPA